jgi:hypothetical protein
VGAPFFDNKVLQLENGPNGSITHASMKATLAIAKEK